MKTVLELLRLDGKIIIYSSSENVCRLFFRNAEAEGFSFGDGIKPSEKETSDLIAIHHDLTMAYLGSAGHQFFCGDGWSSPEDVTFIDYVRYISGRKDYVIKKVKGFEKKKWRKAR